MKVILSQLNENSFSLEHGSNWFIFGDGLITVEGLNLKVKI